MPELIRVVGLGAGGHARVMLEALTELGGFEVVALVDPRRDLWGLDVLGVTVVGGDDLLARQYDGGVSHAFIGLGGASDTRPRQRLYELAGSHGFEVLSVVHPRAVVSRSARLGRGATVLAAAVVNTGAELGENVIVNTAAVVEHDCRLAAHVHIATGARLASGVKIGEGVHIGAGATVIQAVSVGDKAVVGAGAVVIRDVTAGEVVAGVPARPIGARE